MTENSIVIAVAAINVCLALANLICCILRCLEDKQEEVKPNAKSNIDRIAAGGVYVKSKKGTDGADHGQRAN